MFEYIAKIIEELPMELDGEPTSPAANHLFEVDDKGIKLKPEQKDLFHEFVAKLLFLGKRARPDLQTAISFLSTRVREPNIGCILNCRPPKLVEYPLYSSSISSALLISFNRQCQVLSLWLTEMK